MEDCIFCKIVKGEIPSFKVYEDNKFLGFLDIRPLNPGNVLLIPKDHYRWVTDVPDFGEYFDTAKKIGLASQEAVAADYLSFLTLGTEVPHAHIRIIPRFYTDTHTHGIDTNQVTVLPQEEMERLAASISSKIKT